MPIEASCTGKFAFPHNATFVQICGLSRHANLEIRTTRCLLPSVVKDRRFDHLFPIKTSPLQAERSVDLEPTLRKKWAIKNPATSAGRIRPSLEPLRSRDSRTDVLEARFLSTRYL